ncbi:MAG TPA: Spy/CpxP family protein refolding chaperone [Pseudolabrys sp.]|nr:Spy/CpxP family protein refolding chaperone [Pseudolabrys sp.]
MTVLLMCPGVTDLPIDRIAQAVQPTPAQRAALDELKDASVKAAEGLKVNCALQVAAFRAALGEAGYVERQNVAIDGAGLC